MIAKRIIFKGTVQGVGFRFTANSIAGRYGIAGWVRNKFDGTVEMFAQDASQDQQFPLGSHIELARQAELLCVAPASANLIAQAALGMADNLLSTLLLSFTGPVLLAPAMNCGMWSKPSVQRNIAMLGQDGVEMIDPTDGWLSCRDQGKGRMAEPAVIRDAILARLG